MENKEKNIAPVSAVDNQEKSVQDKGPIKRVLAAKKSAKEAKKVKITEQERVWDIVQTSRHKERPTAYDFINNVFDDFVELHGDRLVADDAAIVGGIASLDGMPVTVIGQQKGRDTEENIKRRFGMPNPDGYRKALRLMKQAEKFDRPIVTFIDTPGAYPGLEAEMRGQGEAIARNLLEMSKLEVPVIAIVIGEGGSGGALALAVSDQVWMLENSFYSILSPEGFASILWKDGKKAAEAAVIMKSTAKDLKQLGVIDKIIKESSKGAHVNPNPSFTKIRDELILELKKLDKMSKTSLLRKRFKRFRDMGQFKDGKK